MVKTSEARIIRCEQHDNKLHGSETWFQVQRSSLVSVLFVFRWLEWETETHVVNKNNWRIPVRFESVEEAEKFIKRQDAKAGAHASELVESVLVDTYEVA